MGSREVIKAEITKGWENVGNFWVATVTYGGRTYRVETRESHEKVRDAVKKELLRVLKEQAKTTKTLETPMPVHYKELSAWTWRGRAKMLVRIAEVKRQETSKSALERTTSVGQRNFPKNNTLPINPDKPGAGIKRKRPLPTPVSKLKK